MEKFIEIIGAKSHNLKNINCPHSKRKDHCHHGCFRLGEIDPGLRYPLCRGTEALHRIPLHLCPPVLEKMDRPDVEAIHGIPPAIAIEQRNTVKNARSTVGTASEIYDYLRLLFAKIGEVFCPQCHIKVSGETVESVVEQILGKTQGKKILILSPVSLAEGEEIDSKMRDFIKNGYYRIWEEGEILDLTSLPSSRFPES